MRFFLTGVAAFCLMIAGCEEPQSTQLKEDIALAKTAMKSGQATDLLEPQVPLRLEAIKAHIEALAADDMEGRAPATPGGDKSEAYLVQQMKAAGLKPGNGDSYKQAVPMVSITLKEDTAKASLSGGGVDHTLKFGEEIVYHTRRVSEKIAVENTEIVFVGYGIVAPEYGHDDYAGLDVKGKTVVMLVNDPGYATGQPDYFKGRSMTYYGRWTYKYEEASRQGAAAALIIHDTGPASYGWNVVDTGWRGPQLNLRSSDGNKGRVAVEGWISNDFAKELFAAAGMTFDDEVARAIKRDFKARDMGAITLDISFSSELESVTANNIIGLVEGSEAPDEVMLYMAHFDHLGVQPQPDGSDPIFNGAVDNATGTAAIMEIGRAFAVAKTPPRRSVMIAAVTAEESGLLGSAYLAENPPVPLRSIIGGINVDAIIPTSAARNITVVGLGASELEDILKTYASADGLTLSPEGAPEAGLFYRSDHISLSKKGVPMLYLDSGEDLVEGGVDAGRAAAQAYYRDAYHGPGDEFSQDWDFGTIEQVSALAYRTGNAIVRSEDWPNWYEGNEFKALRDAMRSGEAGAR